MFDQKKYYKKWRKSHREYCREYMKKWSRENPERIKEIRQKTNEKNREKKRTRDREYANTIRKIRRRERRKLNAKYRLDCNMASIISVCLNNKKEGRKWESLVGYTIEDLILHLGKQFNDKMNWDNYGSYWWIDHIKPKSLFKYKKPEDQDFKKCWALENLQPLEKTENMEKGDKY